MSFDNDGSAKGYSDVLVRKSWSLQSLWGWSSSAVEEESGGGEVSRGPPGGKSAAEKSRRWLWSGVGMGRAALQRRRRRGRKRIDGEPQLNIGRVV